MPPEVPELFDPVKPRLAFARARAQGGATFLLERACADLADRLAPILRPFECALDLGTPDGAFGEVLRRLYPARLAIDQYDGEDLRPFDQSARDAPFLGLARYDLIVSGMLLHRVNDLPGLLVQMRQSLKPDGLFIACCPGGDTLTELRQSLLAAEAEITGGAMMRVAPFIDVRAAGQLLQRAGLALPVTDSEKFTVRYASMFRLIADLRAMAASGTLLRRGPSPLPRAVVMRAAAIYGERFADADGRIRATFEFIWMSGWAPHERQQQPLKPGSARTKLADALKALSEKPREGG